MASDQTQELLRGGIAAARNGDKATARRLLRAVIDRDANNELAWIWLAAVVDSPRERRAILERVLAINPDNERAKAALQRMREEMGATPPSNDVEDDEGRGFFSTFLVFALFAVGTVAIFFIISEVTTRVQQANVIPPTQPISAAELALTPSATPTLTVTPPFIPATASRIPLPPTFTPTPSPTPTDLPPPTATPLPLEDITLLVASRREGDVVPALFETDGAGTSPREVTSNVQDVAYSPDGDLVTFSRPVSYDTGEEGAGGPVEANEIFLASPDNLPAPEQLTELRTASAFDPAISPNGQFVLFVTDFDGDDEIFLYDRENDDVIKLTDNQFQDRDPSWSPDDNRFVFASDRQSPGLTDLYTFTFVDDAALLPEDSTDGGLVERITDLAGSSFDPVWSPTGDRIVYANDRTGDGELYTIAPDGQRNRPVLTRIGAEDLEPSWSPDERYLFFLSNEGGAGFGVYRYEFATRETVRLTDAGGSVQSFAVRPNPLVTLRTRANR